MSEALDKYLARQPLTPELAAMKAGRDEEPTPGEVRIRALIEEGKRGLEAPLTDADRQDLRELRQHPGWTVFIRLTKRAMAIHEKTAIVVSKKAPLANAEGISQEWGAVAAFERACSELTGLVDAELIELARNEEGTNKQ